jgi:hypothetical protein
MVLQRKDKRRYLLVYVNDKIFSDSLTRMHASANSINDQKFHNIFRELTHLSSGEYKNNSTSLSKIKDGYNDYYLIFSKFLKKRFFELFGSIELEKANITLIYKQDLSSINCFIIRCNLVSIEKVLFTLSCYNPPLTTITISGTLKKLIKSSKICNS